MTSCWLKNGNIRPREEASLCFLQDKNLFLGKNNTCPHCGKVNRTVDYLATKCDRMLGYDYVRRHNEVVRCIHLGLCNKYGFITGKKLKTHSVQELRDNKYVEMRVDTRIKTDIRVQHDRPDIYLHDKKKNEIILIEVGITSQNLLIQVENEMKRNMIILLQNSA